ncbi:lactoylglutathione lyase family protein [Mycolicibacterium rhodesiae NBB3]|jgi:predicted enzyme related to lactoylglutathione lyase|uniref:Lactoylglutathione lyase family protein n=1 Tax=Mycolicibacterium rhodesiae (strain NBB3) TaxID=710685 RepID=G8RNF1_MYCRN|nr:VOC family protein [Mycolicibacterium rhodesiae]AEV71283.1 lactoylglutathione lyase family protein [Mycolicibacterium rhodesiae NBB3]
MSIEHVLAVVPVSDLQASSRWYETLFGRPADNNPMPTLVEWQVVPGGWVQVFADAERAGSGLLNFAVDDLETHISDLRQRGLEPGDITGASKGVHLSAITDPDGNTISLIGGFRVEY